MTTLTSFNKAKNDFAVRDTITIVSSSPTQIRLVKSYVHLTLYKMSIEPSVDQQVRLFMEQIEDIYVSINNLLHGVDIPF